MRNEGTLVGGSKQSPDPGTSASDQARNDATPHLRSSHTWAIRAFAVLTLVYSIYYIGWRWTATLNFDALWFSVPLALAETYGLITSLFLVFTVWHLKKRVPRPAPAGRMVDVFITTYDEPLEIVRRTALGARAIRYPHQTFILDDKKRDEVRALAEELGLGYIRREGNEHAKAGNLNNALKETSGEFILQLDADHVPLPHILDTLLGFFDDPQVAIVQSPQDFYNTDSFTHDVREGGQRLWEEQQIFFNLIQPGKDYWNAAFFCGSCGIIRRTAIEEIGGFSTETITEDMETSLILHGRGWKSVYYAESLAYGLAPGSAGAFHIQRLRWGQGSMQILRKFNPLTYPGLSFGQRVCYFASVTSYFDGIQKLVLFAAPLIFFLTGAFPIQVTSQEFLIRFVPYLVLSLMMFELMTRGVGYLWLAERYNMAKFFTYIRAVSGFFARGKLKFNVTPKGPGHVPFKTYAPQVVLMAVTAAAVVWAILAQRFGWVDYQVGGWGSIAFLANFAWAAWNFGLAGYVVHLSLQLRQQREDHRFESPFPLRYGLHGSGGGESDEPRLGLAINLNPRGMSLRSQSQLGEGDKLDLVLPLATGTAEVSGTIVYRRPVTTELQHSTYTYGIQFFGVPLNVQDAIELHCAHHAVPYWQMRYRKGLKLVSRSADWFGNLRKQRRYRANVPVEVFVGRDGQEQLGILENRSRSGARIILTEPVSPGKPIRYRVPGTDRSERGRVIFSRVLETPLGNRYAVGIRRKREPASPKKRSNRTEAESRVGAAA